MTKVIAVPAPILYVSVQVLHVFPLLNLNPLRHCLYFLTLCDCLSPHEEHVNLEPGWASRAYLAGVWEGLVVVGAILHSALRYVAAGIVPQRVLTCGGMESERVNLL